MINRVMITVLASCYRTWQACSFDRMEQIAGAVWLWTHAWTGHFAR